MFFAKVTYVFSMRDMVGEKPLVFVFVREIGIKKPRPWGEAWYVGLNVCLVALTANRYARTSGGRGIASFGFLFFHA